MYFASRFIVWLYIFDLPNIAFVGYFHCVYFRHVYFHCVYFHRVYFHCVYFYRVYFHCVYFHRVYFHCDYFHCVYFCRVVFIFINFVVFN